MICLLPLFFSVDEPLGADPNLAQELARRAAGVLRAAGTLCGGDNVLIAALPEGADDAPALAAHPEHVVHVADVAPAPFRGLPPGLGRSVQALRRMTDAPWHGHESVIALDPRAALATPPVLAEAVWRFRSSQRLLVSAVTPTDHPCQGKLLFGSLHDFRLLGEGAQAVIEGANCIVTVAEPDNEGPFALDLRPPGAIIRLFPDGRKQNGLLQFTTPLGTLPPAATRWRLLAARNELPNPTALPVLPPEAPWKWDAATARVINLETGRPLAGRQDFPTVLEPDGSFCVALLEDASSRTPWPERVDVMRQAPDRSLRITNRLDILRWKRLRRQGA